MKQTNSNKIADALKEYTNLNSLVAAGIHTVVQPVPSGHFEGPCVQNTKVVGDPVTFAVRLYLSIY